MQVTFKKQFVHSGMSTVWSYQHLGVTTMRACTVLEFYSNLASNLKFQELHITK